MAKINEVTIFTDGSCAGNPGPGGCGIVFLAANHEREMSVPITTITTNNQAELHAILTALSELKWPCTVRIHTDSKLAVGWLTGQMRRKQPEIADICAQIDQVIQTKQHDVAFTHIPRTQNHRADRLAKAATQQATTAHI